MLYPFSSPCGLCFLYRYHKALYYYINPLRRIIFCVRYYEGMHDGVEQGSVSNIIRDAIVVALREGGFDVSSIDFVVEHPEDSEHGDYASNVAMVAGRQVGRNPRDVAGSLRKDLEGVVPQVERVEVAGHGFLNFYLSRDFFYGQIRDVCDVGEQWGRRSRYSGKEVLVEYTSPNLFKPLHVGNLVGNIIGESVARLFEMQGALVRRINYPSDIGLTVAKGVWGLQKSGGDATVISALGEAYRIGSEAYETDELMKEEIEGINQQLYIGDNSALQSLWFQGKETSLSHLDDLCRQLGTTFDTVIFESEVSDAGCAIVRRHVAGGIFEEDDGAVIFRGERYGLHTRVFINSQGLPTYEAKDLGNFACKQEVYPSWDYSVVVTGNEQREYFQVLLEAIRKVFPDTQKKHLEHIATGFLTLSTGKMSSRKGSVLTGESLLADLEREALVRAKDTRSDDVDTLSRQIAVAALKYQILRRTVGSNIVFDKEQAFSFEGDSGPYLQYTYVRCLSVLEKAEEVGVVSFLKEESAVPGEAFLVERLVCRFPEVIVVSLEKRSPHHLVAYLTELAGLFNSFYAQERIVDSDDPFSSYKVMVTRAVAQTLKNGLWGLGIEVSERM